MKLHLTSFRDVACFDPLCVIEEANSMTECEYE